MKMKNLLLNYQNSLVINQHNKLFVNQCAGELYKQLINNFNLLGNAQIDNFIWYIHYIPNNEDFHNHGQPMNAADGCELNATIEQKEIINFLFEDYFNKINYKYEQFCIMCFRIINECICNN